MGVRLDKWLQVARVFKTRSRATAACRRRQVRVNGAPAKPHRELAVDDRVEVELGDRVRILVVRRLADRPVAKALAATLFDDRTPPLPAIDPVERLRRRPPVIRQPGAGRPTKKQRRQLDRWRTSAEEGGSG